eukprot:Lithocolla_globosa_v1_NODE_191_length_5320_cov_8.118139.p1 type:complete len:945 gc:universal NODE_191_length_5320_cov_8.118139:1092-3926(+)
MAVISGCLDTNLKKVKPKDPSSTKSCQERVGRPLAQLEQLKTKLRREERNLKKSGSSKDLKQAKTKHLLIVRLHHKIKKKNQQQSACSEELKSFHRDPEAYVNRIVNPEQPDSFIKPQLSAADLQKELKNGWTDENFGLQYNLPEGLNPLPEVQHECNMDDITLEEYEQIVMARPNSQPSPFDQIGFRFWKKCRSTFKYVIFLINLIFKELRKGTKPNIRDWKTFLVRLLYKGKQKPVKDPRSFRHLMMIKCIAKLTTCLFAKRGTKFIVANGYLHVSQKAGLPGVSGCIEHHFLFDTIMDQAWSGKRSVFFCATDVSEAYQSTRHSLIEFAVRYHNFPESYVLFVIDWYEDIMVQVEHEGISFVEWLRIGVLTGDPLAVLLFILIMNLFLRRLHEKDAAKLGVKVLKQATPALGFMDDVNLLCPTPRKLKALANIFDTCLDWTKCLKSAADKSETLGLVNGKRVEVDLKAGVPEKKPVPACRGKVRILGKFYGYSAERRQTQDKIIIKWGEIMNRIERKNLPSPTKLKVAMLALSYHARWEITIYDLPTSFGLELSAALTCWWKKWGCLSPSTCASVLFLPHGYFGLNLPNPLLMLRQGQISRMLTLEASRDPLIKKLYTRRLAVETKRELKPSKYNKFRSAVMANNIKELVTKEAEVPPSIKSIRKKAGTYLRKQANTELSDHLKALPVQGKIARDTTIKAPRWMKEAFSQNRRLLKFGLNGLIDCLPSGANLVRWHKTLNAACPKCGNHQTLFHILSHCEESLTLYLWRHNRVLLLLSSFLQKWLPKSWEVWVDLPGNERHYQSFPSVLAESDQRPDLVAFRNPPPPGKKEAILLELTVPADTGCVAAKMRKELRYDNPLNPDSLVKKVRENFEKTTFVTIEVGALGSLPKDELKNFFKLTPGVQRSVSNKLLLDLSIKALEGSERIFALRNKKTESPDLN